jgi:hypothetical protein
MGTGESPVAGSGELDNESSHSIKCRKSEWVRISFKSPWNQIFKVFGSGN